MVESGAGARSRADNRGHRHLVPPPGLLKDRSMESVRAGMNELFLVRGNMEKISTFMIVLIALGMAGCPAANRPPLNANPDDIIQRAAHRAEMEWMCGGVSGAIKGVKEPPPRQHWYDPDLPTEYTVAVEGCGRSSTYWVVCPVDAARCYVVVPGERAPTYVEETVPGSGISPKK